MQPESCKNFYDEVFRQIENVCKFPESGALIENEYLENKTIMRFLVDNYTVYYKTDGDAAIIYIVRIAYSRRNLDGIIKALDK